MSKIGILVIHGMGTQKEGYSKDFEREITDRLGPDAVRFAWQEIYWANPNTRWNGQLRLQHPIVRPLL